MGFTNVKSHATAFHQTAGDAAHYTIIGSGTGELNALGASLVSYGGYGGVLRTMQ